jgi:hypothetical protein
MIRKFLTKIRSLEEVAEELRKRFFASIKSASLASQHLLSVCIENIVPGARLDVRFLFSVLARSFCRILARSLYNRALSHFVQDVFSSFPAVLKKRIDRTF